MGKFKQYIEWFKTIQRFWLVRILAIIWVTSCTYDQLLAQYVPEEFAKYFPKTWEIVILTGNLLPFWGWLLILAGIIVVASVEYAIRSQKQQERKVSTKEPIVRTVKPYQHGFVTRKGYLNIRNIGDQTYQTLDGHTLVIKWRIMPRDLLRIVKEQRINVYPPDKSINTIANKTEQDFEENMAFYSEENEIDEDVILRFRFKHEDIKKFERHNELMKRKPVSDIIKEFSNKDKKDDS